MTDYTRLIEAARSVIAAEDIREEPAPTTSAWLRQQAEKREAQEKALAQLREALGEIDQK
ncbi:MAG TPA: hypothetical protein VKA94_00165 [Hyphomicrobiales bacterium]|nr:hypothetical protein [Hyphomicrobiales bacterium]